MEVTREEAEERVAFALRAAHCTTGQQAHRIVMVTPEDAAATAVSALWSEHQAMRECIDRLRSGWTFRMLYDGSEWERQVGDDEYEYEPMTPEQAAVMTEAPVQAPVSLRAHIRQEDTASGAVRRARIPQTLVSNPLSSEFVLPTSEGHDGR